MRVVLSNGRSFRIGKKTIKGVTGLDLVSLIVGSEGVLAFVTEITLRLLPKPPCVLAAMLQFSNRESAIEAAGKVKASSAFPRSIEFMDSSSLLALQKSKLLPQALEGVAALLLVEVDGIDEASVLTALRRVEDAAQGVGFIGATVAVDERQRQNLWKIRRQLSEATKRLAKYKISEDIVVPLSRMKELLADVDSIAIKHDIATCAFGHAGDGNLHIQIFFNDEGTRKKLPQVLNELFEATIRHDGTLTGEHGIGIAKKPFLKLEQEDDLIELQKQLKKVFDPSGLLNPGKFL
jgi:glycolate oxidase